MLNNIRASSYFRPRLIVACLASLPNLRYLTIEFSVPIPGPCTERRLLGEQRAPVALPSLEIFWFKGVGAYLESLVSQIRAPLLEKLTITLFNQIAFALPHLSYLINITKVFKLPYVSVHLGVKKVFISVGLSAWSIYAFSLYVICKPLDWQIDCGAQICHELIPALPCVEKLSLVYDPFQEIPTEWQNGAIDSATWHDLLRSFIEVKELCIGGPLLEELSYALEGDEVRSDPGFLPNLRTILAEVNMFASFVDARQVMGHPVAYSLWDEDLDSAGENHIQTVRVRKVRGRPSST